MQGIGDDVDNQDKLVDGLPEKVRNMGTEVDNRIYQVWKTLLDLKKEVRRTVVQLNEVNTRFEKVERAALFQENETCERSPAGYWSPQLDWAECSYSVTEYKCLALVWAVKTLRTYLLANEFDTYTDQESL